MKTNQIMKRPMGEFVVEQRTKDTYFNATDLLKAWNENTGSRKEVKDYLSNQSTKEFIKALAEEENLNGDKSPYLATIGKNGGTWMHPLYVRRGTSFPLLLALQPLNQGAKLLQ